MHPIIERRRSEITELCQRAGVIRLDVFGSATGRGFDERTSDVDFAVEFAARDGFDPFEAYFTLKEGLESLLGLPVDLVTTSSVKNPYFRQQLEQTREALYAA